MKKEIIDIIIEKGANINVVNEKGQNALMIFI